ncbi:MAG: hypothetical protein HQM10_18545 [Candidatus Riflebacteria bacterium]|nr:hypothetical protein [Candidatus Riflebacteria bacterium]
MKIPPECESVLSEISSVDIDLLPDYVKRHIETCTFCRVESEKIRSFSKLLNELSEKKPLLNGKIWQNIEKMMDNARQEVPGHTDVSVYADIAMNNPFVAEDEKDAKASVLPEILISQVYPVAAVHAETISGIVSEASKDDILSDNNKLSNVDTSYGYLFFGGREIRILQYSYLLIISVFLWHLTSVPQPVFTEYLKDLTAFSTIDSLHEYLPFIAYLLFAAFFSALSAPILVFKSKIYSIEISQMFSFKKHVSMHV